MVLFNALQKSISAGIGRYSFELSKELYFLLGNDMKIIIREEDLKDYGFVNSKSLLIFKDIKGSRDRNLFEQIYLPKIINDKFKHSVVHYPDSIGPIFLKNNKFVITVHDLAFKTISNSFTLKTKLWKNLMTNISVKKSNSIISITNFSKNELCKYYKGIEDKVNVIHNGFNKLSDLNINLKNVSENLRSITNKKYVLTVSTISPRKNIDTLIKGFNLIKENFDVNLIIGGSNGWLYESIYNLVNDLCIKDRVFFTGKVNEDELRYLYKNAEIFVYPSLYEGFGLPPLESMSYKVKTIVSNVECFREVLGNECLYFEPKDYKGLAKILKDSFQNSNHEKKYNYDDILNKYSWEKCAKETAGVYEKILKGV